LKPDWRNVVPYHTGGLGVGFSAGHMGSPVSKTSWGERKAIVTDDSAKAR